MEFGCFGRTRLVIFRLVELLNSQMILHLGHLAGLRNVGLRNRRARTGSKILGWSLLPAQNLELRMGSGLMKLFDFGLRNRLS